MPKDFITVDPFLKNHSDDYIHKNVGYPMINGDYSKAGCTSLKCHLDQLENKVTDVIKNVSHGTLKAQSVKNVIFNYLSWSTGKGAIKTRNINSGKIKENKLGSTKQTRFFKDTLIHPEVLAVNKLCARSRSSSYSENVSYRLGDSGTRREKLCDDEIKLFLDNVCVVDDHTLVLDPSVSHLIQNVTRPQELEDAVRIKDYRNIIATVNDSDGFSEGSHWSVLAYEGASRSYFHLDSLSGYNTRCAEHLAHNLELCRGYDYAPTVKNIPCLQQDNGTDCGYYMLNNTKIICKLFNSNQPLATHLDMFKEQFCIDSITRTLNDLKIKNNVLRPFSSVLMDDEIDSFSKKTRLLCWGSSIVDSFHNSL